MDESVHGGQKGSNMYSCGGGDKPVVEKVKLTVVAEAESVGVAVFCPCSASCKSNWSRGSRGGSGGSVGSNRSGSGRRGNND